MLRLKRQQKRLMDSQSIKFIAKVWRLLAPFHRTICYIIAISLVFEIARMGSPYLFGRILDTLVKSKGLISIDTALTIVAGLAVIRVSALIIDYLTDILIARFLWGLERYTSTTTFNKLLELSLDYHEQENTGTKIGIVNKGRENLVNLMASFSWEFLSIVLQLMVVSVIMYFISWRIGLIFSLSLVPFTVITFRMQMSTNKVRVKRHDTYEVSSGEIGDTISNISVVKAFAQEQREKYSFQSIWDLIRNLTAREFKIQVLAGVGRSFIIEIFYFTLLVIGIVEVKYATLSVGMLVFLINLIERSYSNIYRLGRIYDRMIESSESVNRITELLKKQPSISNAQNPLLPQIDGKIVFRKVNFAYNKKRILQNLSFTIQAGSFTALVGKSGSGKSTIAKLLSRYYDPNSGQILINGKYDLKKVDLDYYRQQTAVVFQDSPVPNRKIWEVIAYAAGKKSFTEVRQRVIEAAKLAHAEEFIAELDNGYQTLIGERGVKLSGGQRQRIAIARALFARPKILIMDEPTSHLDTLSESQIQQALEDISKERSFTKIIIAHRLSTVQHADQILVMENGRLVEQGNHAELLKKNGSYAAIVHQSELKP